MGASAAGASAAPKSRVRQARCKRIFMKERIAARFARRGRGAGAGGWGGVPHLHGQASRSMSGLMTEAIRRMMEQDVDWRGVSWRGLIALRIEILASGSGGVGRSG